MPTLIQEGSRHQLARLRRGESVGTCILQTVVEVDGSATLDRILRPLQPDPDLEQALFAATMTRWYEPARENGVRVPVQFISTVLHCPVLPETWAMERSDRSPVVPTDTEPMRRKSPAREDAWLLDTSLERPVILGDFAFRNLEALRGQPGRSHGGFCPVRVIIEKDGSTTFLGPRFESRTADPDLEAALRHDISERRYEPARLDGEAVPVETIIAPRNCPTLVVNDPTDPPRKAHAA